MHKIMILTDSNGNPRCFPVSEVFHLEDTYPYLLRQHFKETIFWQLSYGDITSTQLLSQPIGYLTHWNPDMIIVQTGINDCKPELPLSSFRSTIKKFRLVFPKSKFFWLSICVGAKYENICPGINNRIDEYNEIIEQVYGEDFISIGQIIREVDGFNACDHVHFNKRAHQAVAELLVKKIRAHVDSAYVKESRVA